MTRRRLMKLSVISTALSIVTLILTVGCGAAAPPSPTVDVPTPVDTPTPAPTAAAVPAATPIPEVTAAGPPEYGEKPPDPNLRQPGRKPALSKEDFDELLGFFKDFGLELDEESVIGFAILDRLLVKAAPLTKPVGQLRVRGVETQSAVGAVRTFEDGKFLPGGAYLVSIDLKNQGVVVDGALLAPVEPVSPIPVKFARIVDSVEGRTPDVTIAASAVCFHINTDRYCAIDDGQVESPLSAKDNFPQQYDVILQRLREAVGNLQQHGLVESDNVLFDQTIIEIEAPDHIMDCNEGECAADIIAAPLSSIEKEDAGEGVIRNAIGALAVLRPITVTAYGDTIDPGSYVVKIWLRDNELIGATILGLPDDGDMPISKQIPAIQAPVREFGEIRAEITTCRIVGWCTWWECN